MSSSLSAIQQLLIDTFPEIDTIYLSTVPDGFTRPSFLLESIISSDQDLNSKYYTLRLTWQVVYFGPLNAADVPKKLNQFSVSDALKKAIMEKRVLVSDDGTVFHVVDCAGGPRDTEVYITVRLDVDASRPEPAYEDMQDIEIDIKT